jgi:DNA-binding winged helix-turn-helix (wHTH) protein
VDFEQAISRAVMRLRDALGDSTDSPIFTETIERRRYRWIGPIRQVEPVSEQSRENAGKINNCSGAAVEALSVADDGLCYPCCRAVLDA